MNVPNYHPYILGDFPFDDPEYDITMNVTLGLSSDAANGMTSLTKWGTHGPLLDIDTPEAVEFWSKDRRYGWDFKPSSTEGHCHAFCFDDMPWCDYRDLLQEVVDAEGAKGDPKWASISLRRGYGVLRLPHVKKADNTP